MFGEGFDPVGERITIGRSQEKGDVRTYRVDRIGSVETTSARFEVPASFDLDQYRRERLFVPSADGALLSRVRFLRIALE